MISVLRQPRPLSRIKFFDLTHIAQRMLDQTGCVNARMLHTKASSRIPGSFTAYNHALNEMAQRRKLNASKKRHYSQP